MAAAPSTSMPAAGPSGSAPAASGSTASAPATISSHISSVNVTTFGMPVGIHLPIFDGSEYSPWAGMLEAIFVMERHVNAYYTVMTNVSKK